MEKVLYGRTATLPFTSGYRSKSRFQRSLVDLFLSVKETTRATRYGSRTRQELVPVTKSFVRVVYLIPAPTNSNEQRRAVLSFLVVRKNVLPEGWSEPIG